MAHRPLRSLGTVPALALLLSGCSGWFLSGIDYPNRSHPVVQVDTRGGVEFGAATEFGILFLGRTAQEGPCRVHYFLDEQVLVEDGRIEPFGGVFLRAAIDRKHNAAKLWTREVRPSDPLFAMVLDRGVAQEIPVRLANAPAVSGDVLDPPSRPLPVGTPLFIREVDADTLWFVGLVSGAATLEPADGAKREFLVFAGPQCVRDALLTPEDQRAPVRIKYRPNGSWVETQDSRGPTKPRVVDRGGGD